MILVMVGNNLAVPAGVAYWCFDDRRTRYHGRRFAVSIGFRSPHSGMSSYREDTMKSKASKFCGGALAVMSAHLGLAAQVVFAFLVLLIPVNVLAVGLGDTVVPSSYATTLKPGKKRHYYQNRNHQRRVPQNRLG